MNLLLAARKIWQHKLVTLPIIALTLAGAFYVVAVKSPVYEATSSFILVNPPEPPSLDEIDRDPSLLDVNSDNPYTRYSDQSVVAQVLASRLSSDAAREQLETRGADPGYTVAPSVEFGFTAPVVNVTGTGPSPAAAVRTAELLNAAARKELLRMQEIQNVDPKYRIDTQQVVVPQEAQLKASGKLRMLVVVFALGAILLFIAITLIDAIKALRGERPPFDPGRRYLPPGPTPNGGAPALPEHASPAELPERQPVRREVTLWIPDNPAQLPASNGHASAEERQLVETIAAPTTNGNGTSHGSDNGANGAAEDGADEATGKPLDKIGGTARRLWQEARRTINE